LKKSNSMKRVSDLGVGSRNLLDPEQTARQEKYFMFFSAGVLLLFGIYHSVLYFGHTVVPNPDFAAFIQTGRSILSFELPTSFKRVPLLGILQACTGYFVGGDHSDLTAGWLLNSILHPLNLLLFWLVCRQLIGKSAIWIALILIINPQVLYLLTEPIAETTLLFFVLLTFYFIFKRSSWSYLFASLTSMVRYEGAVLIFAAFVIDMIYRRSNRERLFAFLYSSLASIPLALWIVGTCVFWKGQGAGHYLSVFGGSYEGAFSGSMENRVGFAPHAVALWRVGFQFLFLPSSGANRSFVNMLWGTNKIFIAVAFLCGSIYGLSKRNWNILALLLFIVPYFVAHSRWPWPLQRYYSPISWMVLLVCWYGLQGIWKLINGKGRVPKWLIMILQSVLLAMCLIWLVALFPDFRKLASGNNKSSSLPYVAMAISGGIVAFRIYVYKGRYFLREILIMSLVCLIIISNQFAVVRVVGDGQKEKEFKLLADWYIKNAKAGEKLGVYMAPVVRLYAQKYVDDIVSFPKAKSPEDFVKACYEQDITYVVWATREGLSRQHQGYLLNNLDKNIAFLSKSGNIGPYEFMGQVGSRRGYVNIFRLRKPTSVMKQN